MPDIKIKYSVLFLDSHGWHKRSFQHLDKALEYRDRVCARTGVTAVSVEQEQVIRIITTLFDDEPQGR
jgi:hypothetical protein